MVTPLKILIVEDNVDGAESLAMVLRLVGHNVRIAFSAHDGLAAADEFQPEVVLLDIGLPVVNGFEVATSLRERRKEGLAIVAITGYGRSSDRVRAKEAGFDHFFVKPVDPECLTQFLAKVATRKSN
jgi:DNA-binding response OmpR family regulator